MKKPRIRKIKGSPYWCCDGMCALTPQMAYQRWQVRKQWLEGAGA